MAEINSLAIFTKASQMLAEANTIQKAKELKDLALTAKEWAKRKGMGEDAIKYCEEYKRRAEIRLGEMLAVTERQRPGEYQRSPEVTVAPTLAELGISKRESSEAQMLATLSEEKKEEYGNLEKTKSQVRRESKAEKSKNIPLPEDDFNVIYADPPWKYGDTCEEGSVQGKGVDKHYPCMTIQELCDLPVSGVTYCDAVLFLWVTSPLLDECWPIIKAWGFEYKTSFVWDKVKHNMGHYNSVRHEFLLICTKGSFMPQVKTLYDSVQTIERSVRHSEKPEEFRKIIETLYPNSNKLELFGRKKVEGWTVWGNEVDSEL